MLILRCACRVPPISAHLTATTQPSSDSLLLAWAFVLDLPIWFVVRCARPQVLHVVHVVDLSERRGQVGYPSVSSLSSLCLKVALR
jgi:hypothetical protein